MSAIPDSVRILGRLQMASSRPPPPPAAITEVDACPMPLDETGEYEPTLMTGAPLMIWERTP